MVSAIADSLNANTLAIRRERQTRTAAVDVGVVTAVSPLTQTASVRRVRGGAGAAAIDGCRPFAVETPIAVGDLVRMFRHGGETFIAPIETNVAQAIGKDTRVGYVTRVSRTVNYKANAYRSVLRVNAPGPPPPDSEINRRYGHTENRLYQRVFGIAIAGIGFARAHQRQPVAIHACRSGIR